MRSGWMELRRTAADALHTFILGPQRSGVGLLADLLRMGTRGWAWVLLLLATLGTAFVFTLPGAAPQAREGLAHPAGTGLLTLWMAFLWTLLTATAGDLPAAFRLPVAIYGLFYFGVPLLSAAPSLVLIPALALLLFERTHPRSALAGWAGRLLWALALAQFPPHPIRPFLLSLGLKTLLGIGLVSLPLWRSVRIPRMARGGLLALGLTIPYLAAWGSGPEATGEGIRQMLAGVWGLSVPSGSGWGPIWSRRGDAWAISGAVGWSSCAPALASSGPFPSWPWPWAHWPCRLSGRSWGWRCWRPWDRGVPSRCIKGSGIPFETGLWTPIWRAGRPSGSCSSWGWPALGCDGGWSRWPSASGMSPS
jgi:hypothetical protein